MACTPKGKNRVVHVKVGPEKGVREGERAPEQTRVPEAKKRTLHKSEPQNANVCTLVEVKRREGSNRGATETYISTATGGATRQGGKNERGKLRDPESGLFRQINLKLKMGGPV